MSPPQPQPHYPTLRILIDGYNLLFASPWLGKGRGPGWLERARLRLIGHLNQQLPLELRHFSLIIFDASSPEARRLDSLPPLPPTTSSPQASPTHFIHVAFAREHEDADSHLLDLIRTHPAPKQLLVVSTDQQIRRKAKARNAQSWTSEEFLDWLDQGAPTLDPTPNPTPSNDKDLPPLSQDDIQAWKDHFDL